jgi:probable F420-dependent oxidoreductase
MAVRIGIGLAGFPFEDARGFWRWIDLCESSGLDSYWQSDRIVSRDPVLESLSAMAALAGATERLKFGMNVAVVTFRDPVVLAKQCATIDFLSGGRLLPAFGVGPTAAPEWRAAGFDRSERGARADEALELMARLWREESVSFEGRFFRTEAAQISPRPIQDPLPLWIGGSSEAAIRRTAHLGTGWIAGIQTPDRVAPVVRRIARAAADAGRPLDPEHYGAGFSYRFGAWEEPVVEGTARALARFAGDFDPRRYLAVGAAAAILERIDEYREAGISKFVLRPMAVGTEEAMEQTRQLVAEVLPAVHG